MPEKMLSPHFAESEFACECCGIAKVHPGFISTIEDFRCWFGMIICVSSGCRCEKHNRAIGGASASQDIFDDKVGTRAGDLWSKDHTCVMLMYFLEHWNKLIQKNIGVPPFTGLGLYPENAFVHVDVRPQNHISRWVRENGVYRTVSSFKEYYLTKTLLTD